MSRRLPEMRKPVVSFPPGAGSRAAAGSPQAVDPVEGGLLFNRDYGMNKDSSSAGDKNLHAGPGGWMLFAEKPACSGRISQGV